MAVPQPIKLTPLVVTVDDFKNLTGKDLAFMLSGSDNDSDYPTVFLREVQEYLMDWCDERGFRRVKFEDLTDYQMQKFQRAVIWQAYYTWKNGALGIGLESGVDLERGRVLTPDEIRAVEVPDRVVTLMHKAGMFNLKIKNRPRINRGYPGIFGAYTGEDY